MSSVLLLPLAAAAQGTAEAPAAQRVEVTGSTAADTGRDATVARAVVTREDIARYGDTSLADVLRRVPGVTVTGQPGRAAEVRLRGLGAGYTQILINGEAAPPGFSLDALTPSQVERIEVLRVATVDTASQAIAGSINIVLRTQARRDTRQVEATVASREGRWSQSLDARLSDRGEAVSYSLGLALGRRDDRWRSTTLQSEADPAGTPTGERAASRLAFGLARSASLTPKLTWTLDERDQWSVEGLFRRTLFNDHSSDARETLLGAPPAYTSDRLATDLQTTLSRARLQWKHVFGDGAALDARLGANGLRRDSTAHFEGRDELDRLALDEQVLARVREEGVVTGGKLRLPYAEDHAIALGWDAERATREETRQQRQSSPLGRPTADLDESYRTTVTKPALYVQDEWDVDETLSAYTGVRVASLHTRTEGTGIVPTGTRSSVVSPVLQLLKKLGPDGANHLRLALSRTYKAPNAADLVPRRYVSIDNTPATPDLQGNPSLRPELAWGLDAGYEGTLPGRTGTWSTGLTARRIRDVIVERVQSVGGTWIASKQNFGNARVYGLEAELRWQAREMGAEGPDLEVGASLARNWSWVDQVPGPDNRLDGQVPLSAQCALDWKPAGGAFALGGSYAYRATARTRSSVTQFGSTGLARTLDLHALFRATAGLQVRLAVANALAQRETTSERLEDETGVFRQEGATLGSRTVRLSLELKL